MTSKPPEGVSTADTLRSIPESGSVGRRELGHTVTPPEQGGVQK
ncbi:hypothetical protein [Sorangium sp. So ce117]